MPSAKTQVEVVNTMGIHLRPASSIVQLCNQYTSCEVELTKDGQPVNGNSIMSVIMLAAEQGSIITIEVRGEGCEQLIADLTDLFKRGFEEE
jgi:phosphocarrier protein HPr